MAFPRSLGPPMWTAPAVDRRSNHTIEAEALIEMLSMRLPWQRAPQLLGTHPGARASV